MRRRAWLWALLPVAGVLIGLLLWEAGPLGAAWSGPGRPPGAPGLAATSTPPVPCRGWRQVSAPQPDRANDSWLYSVAATGPADAWAVGYYDTLTTPEQTLILHWDGVTWAVIPAPAPGQSSFLYAVAALGATDAWAVGYYHLNGSTPSRTLILHWNGLTWSQIGSPNPASADNELVAVTALGSNDVWAVGRYWPNGSDRPLFLHWDGTSWRTVSSPSVQPYGGIDGVAGAAANDIWAVGYAGASGFTYQPLIEHWDGTNWHITTRPTPGAGSSALWAVAARPGTGAWAVGHTTSLSHTLTMRWDGTRWAGVSSPDSGDPYNILFDVAVVGANDSWAVGMGGPGQRTLALHWDGTAWSIVPSVSPGTDDSLRGIAAVAPNDLWAVGYTAPLGQPVYQSLIERYNDSCATSTPTPGPSVMATPPATVPPSPTATPPRPPDPTPPPASPTTPVGATATPTAPVGATATPTATATGCPLQFSDVPPTQPFYAYIRCLACRGIVSGYADGTYRPGADVTRDQLAKILANSAGLADVIPATQQTFADVPGGVAPQPFWLWIERLAAHGAINGYTCGGPGEPCDGQGRPYYRPGTNATRAQIAKMDAVAAGLADPIPSAQQTFADVLPAYPFWRWIEDLAGRGILSGYACGGPGEPCDDQQRPYFRPVALTTRGQQAKIAAQTFFPDCQTPAQGAGR